MLLLKLRWCQKTLPLGLIDDKITYQKEYIEDLKNSSIEITSPASGSYYEVGEYIESALAANGDKSKLVVRQSTTTNRQYKLRKYTNGVISNPAEYKENGKIYQENGTTTIRNLSDSQYNVELIER